MNSPLPLHAIGLVMVSAPLGVAFVVYRFTCRRKIRPDASETERRSKFGLAYLSIQFVITVMAAFEGFASDGTEDVPVWGMATLTTWGAAIMITPLLSIFGDMVVQVVSRIYRNKNGA